MSDSRLFQMVRDGKGNVTTNALPYGAQGWDLLQIIAMSHEDGDVRIRAAETMVRLSYEFPPSSKGFYGFPVDRDAGEAT